MKNTLLILSALTLALTGCTQLELRPSPSGGSVPGGDVPDAPLEQVIPDRGPVPAVPASTHIVVGLCPATGAYAALGVDTQARKFTFLISGQDLTRLQVLQQFYAAKVPVTIYTATTQLNTDAGVAYNPCLDLKSGMPRIGKNDANGGVIAQVTEDPPPSPKPTGGDRSNLYGFQYLSWRTAFALEAVSHPVIVGKPVF